MAEKTVMEMAPKTSIRISLLANETAEAAEARVRNVLVSEVDKSTFTVVGVDSNTLVCYFNSRNTARYLIAKARVKGGFVHPTISLDEFKASLNIKPAAKAAPKATKKVA